MGIAFSLIFFLISYKENLYYSFLLSLQPIHNFINFVYIYWKLSYKQIYRNMLGVPYFFPCYTRTMKYLNYYHLSTYIIVIEMIWIILHIIMSFDTYSLGFWITMFFKNQLPEVYIFLFCYHEHTYMHTKQIQIIHTLYKFWNIHAH